MRTHIVKAFVKDDVPLPNGLQPLDNVGAPKSRVPSREKKGSKMNPQFPQSVRQLSSVNSFVRVCLKHYQPAPASSCPCWCLLLCPGAQQSMPPPTCCLAGGLEFSSPPSPAGAEPPVPPHLCFAPEPGVPALLPLAVRGSGLGMRKKNQNQDMRFLSLSSPRTDTHNC